MNERFRIWWRSPVMVSRGWYVTVGVLSFAWLVLTVIAWIL